MRVRRCKEGCGGGGGRGMCVSVSAGYKSY